MINPIYKFTLSTEDYPTIQAYPLWKTDMAKEYSKESGQEFFRRKFSGKLTFLASDFDYIYPKPFDTQFDLQVDISYNNGVNWENYLQGKFWKTDCEIDLDSKTVIVTPTPRDEYSAILDGIEKEFNLIELAPEVHWVHYDKRPVIQVYMNYRRTDYSYAGASVIGNFLSGMWWEQEVSSPATGADLTNRYSFADSGQFVYAQKKSDSIQFPIVPEIFGPMRITEGFFQPYDFTEGDFRLRVDDNGLWELFYKGTVYWSYRSSTLDESVLLEPVPGTPATGTVFFYTRQMINFYTRILCDVDEVGDVPTSDVRDDDIAPCGNYKKVLAYSIPDNVYVTRNMSTEPTPYGIFQPGLYYQEPSIPSYQGKCYPCARNSWNWFSTWFKPDVASSLIDTLGRKANVLKDAYPLSSAIEVLLKKIDPTITFKPTPDYSQFLFGENNPITSIKQTLFITPKSNVVNSGYDQPAQRAPVTLKTIANMLRDCFRCYWFVENGKFRIEHISFFMNGGTYTGNPGISRDLTTEIVTRNDKPWAFGTNKFSYDKPEMTGRYQFGWMDNETYLFNGYPIDIDANFVNKEKIEEVTINQFSSDIDYILLNPNEISQDGFVLLSAITEDSQYKLPYMTVLDGYTTIILQNPYVAFYYLQNYYAFDLPARSYSINGVQKIAAGVKKQMSQTITFPCIRDIDVLKLIKTELGLASIEKLSINLSSRQGKATLKYNTQ